ncbi:MAG: polyphosphate kinase Ppk [Idiomarinaceae bacterium HL-53]|nr:MAG: polyphosphate kinase Ppk [Idiomarinaceae bacterium HL-53]CUS49297.1 polyphosphate kinase [Idiomarinaceae bacterium HL-53]
MKFYSKELSWLAFNERVLQEAADPHNPVIERMRFLGIFSNNMDEYFRVRVADVRRDIYYSRNDSDRQQAQALMAQIQSKVIQLQEHFEQLFVEVQRDLAKKKIRLVHEMQLTKKEEAWLSDYFHQQIKAHIVPIIIQQQTDLKSALNEDATYLCVEIEHLGKVDYAAIELPTEAFPRFMQLPFKSTKREKKVIMLDNVIRLCLPALFQGILPFEQVRAYSFKLTRDSEYRLPNDIDQSVLERMEEGLKQRFDAEPVRLVYDGHMPGGMLRFLCNKLELTANDSLVAGGRYRNTRDFAKFPNLGHPALVNRRELAFAHAAFSESESIFATLARTDILVYYPYHPFDHVTELVRQAAYDPKVTSIQMCIYRVAPNSRIVSSLVDAVKNGKKVTAMVELQARFDEEANIEWSKFMTQEGIRVIFGIQGLKVHSKLILIKRREGSDIERYAHIGTGNFHEQTANVYTDFSLLTSHPGICEDVENAFQYLEYPFRRLNFNHLWVSPVSTRERFEVLLEREIEQARQGQKAEVILKVNNLVDESIIVKLYRAARAGVKIKAIVRGMCALRPGIEGLSEGIEVISIVDRYLEHARVFCFHNQGEPLVFISSADLMARNLDHRVEVTAPIYDKVARKQVLGILELQWKDNVKARIIDAEQRNLYRKRGNRKKLRSQIEIRHFLKALSLPTTQQTTTKGKVE